MSTDTYHEFQWKGYERHMKASEELRPLKSVKKALQMIDDYMYFILHLQSWR